MKYVLMSAVVLLFAVSPVMAEQTGRPACISTDPDKYFVAKACHEGASELHYMAIAEGDIFETNLMFVHRGIMLPHSSIGEHIHRTMEEMYIIFDGTAEFTVNGRTAELPAGSMALCRKGWSHGIYNPNDFDVNYINIGVTMEKGKYDAVNYNDDLTGQTVESPPPFLYATMDRRLNKPVRAHLGKGEILFNRLWEKHNFLTNWEFVDHCILPPDTSIGLHRHTRSEEVYYILSGSGRITVNDQTWDVTEGDCVPCTLNDTHGIYNNTDEELVVLVINVVTEKGIQRNPVNIGDDLSTR